MNWLWWWAALGLGAVLALASGDAPAWGYALATMAWGLAGGVWLQRDAARESAPLAPPAEPQAETAGRSSVAEPPDEVGRSWQNWISGWYWETDAQHGLTVLKPGVWLAGDLELSWDALCECVSARPILWEIWAELAASPAQPGSDTPMQQAGCEPLARLRYSMAQRQAWPDALRLPWPAAFSGVAPDGHAAAALPRECELRGAPRWGRDGAFLGFQGVLYPVMAPRALADDEGEGSAASHAAACEVTHPMTEAEQEVLRYALSHDLRAPLRVVEGFTRIVKEDYGRLLDRIGHDHLDRVLSASGRMNNMIDAILAQAQLAGAVLERQPIDLSGLARDVGAELSALVPGEVRAHVEVAEDMQTSADPVLVRRVLENLLGNALKYSAKVPEPCIEVGVMPATNPAVYFVRDNGAGFDMQHADKLFGLFQRLHSAKEFPGTGVGLAGVQNIIRRHGGQVWAEARPGQGACFYFTLMDTAQAQQQTGGAAGR